MEIVPNRALKELRRLNKRNLPLSTQLLEEVIMEDGSGGEETLGWKVYDDTKCCRLSPVDPQERIVGDQLSADVQWWVIFECGVTIPHQNKIMIGNRIFRIMSPGGDRSNQIMSKFLCIEDTDPNKDIVILENG